MRTNSSLRSSIRSAVIRNDPPRQFSSSLALKVEFGLHHYWGYDLAHDDIWFQCWVYGWPFQCEGSSRVYIDCSRGGSARVGLA